MVRARYDEPIWGDARRVTHSDAFTPETEDERELRQERPG
jgi:hypothetical protein